MIQYFIASPRTESDGSTSLQQLVLPFIQLVSYEWRDYNSETKCWHSGQPTLHLQSFAATLFTLPKKTRLHQIVQGFSCGSSFVPIFAELFPPPSHHHLSRLRRWYGSPYEDRGRLVGQIVATVATCGTVEPSKMSLRMNGVRSRCNLGGGQFLLLVFESNKGYLLLFLANVTWDISNP